MTIANNINIKTKLAIVFIQLRRMAKFSHLN